VSGGSVAKRRVNPGLGFFSFKTARRAIGGYEAMNIIRKGQVGFVSSLFSIAV